jgi:DNA invertase Pin-like site-specific DNA recombinase
MWENLLSHKNEEVFAMAAPTPIPAARYLRMSTDKQKLSLEYQAKAIAAFAERHAFNIVRSYEDPGKSGLTLKRRKGLAQLLHDVTCGDRPFKAVLVYDVSRWGRFQDTDEAAHYEFICKSAGTPVYYCAETFKNNGSPPTAIMKTLKRVMAAEYSRELSVRLRRTKTILTQRGFRVGGIAGYGLRRMLVSFDGSPIQKLHVGDRKTLASGRVVLVPGPAREVARIREIYRLKNSGMSASAIARKFNREGLRCAGARWKGAYILDILRNQKYIGWAVWGRTKCRLGSKQVPVPRDRWTVNPEAFEAVVDHHTYERAQHAIANRTCNKTQDELLDALRRILRKHGRISQHLINSSHMVPSSSTYAHRFGSVRKAYALIGYEEFKNHEGMLKMRRTHRRVQLALMSRIERALQDEGSFVRGTGCRRVLRLNNGVRISMLICECINIGNGAFRWRVPVNRFERHLPSLICRCTKSNRSIKDIYLVQCVETTNTHSLSIKENDPWLKMGKRIDDLSKLPRIAIRMLRRTNSSQVIHQDSGFDLPETRT